MSDSFTQLAKHPQLWRASYKPSADSARVASGFATLDSALGGGWPLAGLIRVRAQKGIGEVELFLTLLRAVRHHRLIMFVNPPGLLQANWLIKQNVDLNRVFSLTGQHEENLWAAEQCLKSDACHAVLLWSEQRISLTQARRLQVCAKQHHSLCILFEHPNVQRLPFPLELDLSIKRQQTELTINIEKQMGGWPQPGLKITFSPHPDNQPIISAFEKYADTYTEHVKVS